MLHQMIQLPNHGRQSGRVSQTSKGKGKSNFILLPSMKAQRGSTGMALLFL